MNNASNINIGDGNASNKIIRKKRFLSLTGFSLVEVVVSMVIIATVMTALLATFVATKRYNIRARLRLQAANYARQWLEELKNDVDASTWDSGTSLLNVTADWEDAGTMGNINRSYRVDDIGSEYRRVTVRVTWNVSD